MLRRKKSPQAQPKVVPPLLGLVTRVHAEAREAKEIARKAKREHKEMCRIAAKGRRRVWDAAHLRRDLASLHVIFSAWKIWNASYPYERRKEEFFTAATHEQSFSESRILALEQEAVELRELCLSSESVADIIAEAKQERDEALNRCAQLQAIVDRMSEVAARVAEAVAVIPPASSSDGVDTVIKAEGSIYKAGLHEFLADLDPKYMAPAKCVTLREVIENQQQILEYELQEETEAKTGPGRTTAA